MSDSWIQALTIIGSNLAFFIWTRTEARHDQQEIREKIDKMDEKITRIDKEVAVITATLQFNGYNLEKHKAEGE